MDLKTHFAVRIKALRDARELTQEQLAALIGRSTDSVSKIERRLTVPNLETIYKIADALEVPVSQLVELDETDRAKPDAERIALLAQASELIRRLPTADLKVAVEQLRALVER